MGIESRLESILLVNKSEIPKFNYSHTEREINFS